MSLMFASVFASVFRLSIIIAFALLPRVTFAGIVALDTFPTTSSPGGTVGNAKHLAGWEFSISSAISVTQLGVIDADENGTFGNGSASGNVAIWRNSDAAVVAQASVSNASTLSGGVFYESIAPVILAPGNYTIATVTGSSVNGLESTLFFNNGNPTGPGGGLFTTSSSVTYVTDRIRLNVGQIAITSANLPTFTFPLDGWFGPNFQYVVPEPCSSIYLGTIAFFMIGLRRKPLSRD